MLNEQEIKPVLLEFVLWQVQGSGLGYGVVSILCVCNRLLPFLVRGVVDLS